MNILNDFLDTEVSYQDLYEDIIIFITSFHVRNGEFEGNRFIIKKMDQLNFIIFCEDVYKDGRREISYAASFYRTVLLKEIQAYARKKGLLLLEKD